MNLIKIVYDGNIEEPLKNSIKVLIEAYEYKRTTKIIDKIETEYYLKDDK